MLYSFNTENEIYNTNSLRWRVQSTFWFTLSIAIAIAVPFLTEWIISKYWETANQSWFVKATVHNWVEIYAISAIVAFVSFEISMVRMIKSANQNPPVVLLAILENVSKKAGLDTPMLIYEKSNSWCAATTRSFAAGRKVLWQGSHEIFNTREVEAIMAHEVGHLLMRDIRTSMIKHFILGGLRLLSLVLLVLTALVTVVWFLQLVPQDKIVFYSIAMIFVAIWRRKPGFVYLGAVFTIACSMAHWVDPSVPSAIWFAMIMTLLGTVASVLASHAYSRVVEFRTDAVGVAILGEDYREDLIRSLDKVLVRAFRKNPEMIKIYKWLPDILLTHPRNVDRAISLGIKRFTGA